MEIIPFKKAKDFLSYLDPNSGHWGTDWENPWIYRGQWDANWSLTPSAWRNSQPTFDPLIRKYTPDVETWWQKHLDKWNATHDFATGAVSLRTSIEKNNKSHAVSPALVSICEHKVLRDFLLLANDLGLPVDNGIMDSWSVNQYLYGSPRGGWAFPYYNLDPLSLSLAQHYGVPTRLLDWTKDPNKAAYFAIDNQINEKIKPKNIAVWAFKKDYKLKDSRKLESEDLHPAIVPVEIPRNKNPFLHAQDGIFTRIESADQWYLNRNSWPTTEEILNICAAEPDEVLKKLELPFEEVNELRKLLWKKRISRAHLMPTYDNIAKALVSNWQID